MQNIYLNNNTKNLYFKTYKVFIKSRLNIFIIPYYFSLTIKTIFKNYIIYISYFFKYICMIERKKNKFFFNFFNLIAFSIYYRYFYFLKFLILYFYIGFFYFFNFNKNIFINSININVFLLFCLKSNYFFYIKLNKFIFCILKEKLIFFLFSSSFYINFNKKLFTFLK